MKEKFHCEITERKGDHKVRKRRRNMEIKLCPALIKSLKFAAHFMDARGGEAVERSHCSKIGQKMCQLVFIY